MSDKEAKETVPEGPESKDTQVESKDRRSRSRDRDRRRRKRKHKSSRRSRSKEGSRDRDRRRRKRSRRSRSRDRSRRDRSKDRERRREDDGKRREQLEKQKAEEEARRAAEQERKNNIDQYTVFVSQIHPKVDERDLFEFFSHVGSVNDIRLIRDARTQKSKGLCYVEFWEKSDVHKAIALSGQLLGGYPITIAMTRTAEKEPEEPPLKLYVGQLHADVSADDLRPVFEAFGPLDSVEVNRDAYGASMGYGFVQYTKAADGKVALSALDGLPIVGQKIKVALATQRKDNSDPDAAPPAGIDEGVTSLGMDEATGGLHLNGLTKQELMRKLGRGEAMPGILPSVPTTAAAAPSSNNNNNNGVIAASNLQMPMVQPTTCLVVNNMFNPAEETDPEFHLDVKEDVEDELANLQAKCIHIMVDKDSPQGRVYMRFASVPDCMKVQNTFNGRWFAKRQIKAEYVIEQTYLMKFPQAR